MPLPRWKFGGRLLWRGKGTMDFLSDPIFATVVITVKTRPYAGTARESTQHTRAGDAVETGMKNAIRKYWKEGNCRE